VFRHSGHSKPDDILCPHLEQVNRIIVLRSMIEVRPGDGSPCTHSSGVVFLPQPVAFRYWCRAGLLEIFCG
jgi:hypothetical protein